MTDNKIDKKYRRFIILSIITVILTINGLSTIHAKNPVSDDAASMSLSGENHMNGLKVYNAFLSGHPLWPILTPTVTVAYLKISLIQIYGRRLYNYFYGSIYNA